MMKVPIQRMVRFWSVLVLLAAGLCLGTQSVVEAQDPPLLLLPEQVEGLKERALVVYDRWGIPHIFAENTHDLYVMTGYLQARDRLFQMDLTRRQASGTLAELLGPQALESDVMLRTLGLRRAAEATAQYVAERFPEAFAELEAYATGVNAFINQAQAEGKLPPEYQVLELTQVEPWTPVDSLVVGKAIVFQLSFDLDIENTLAFMAYTKVLEALGLNGLALFYEDLWRSAPADPAVSILDAMKTSQAQQAYTETMLNLDRTTERLAREVLEKAKKIAFLKPIFERRTGSNWFMVSGEHTASGYPILANDPHLSLSNPAVWYAFGQKVKDGEELDVTGVGFPGIPYVILGHNRHIAWGATTNPMDVTDTFLEKIVVQDGRLFSFFRGELEPVAALPQTFRVNQVGNGVPDDVVVVPPGRGVPEAVLIVPRHGPVLSLDLEAGEALTVQWAGAGPTQELLTFRIWNRAQSLDDFKEGLKYFDVASQNWAYADVEGNIAYFTSAELPLREDLEQGFVDQGIPPWFIRDGTGTALHQWLEAKTQYPGQILPYEILPPEEMPHIVNPPAGFVVNANNDPIGNTLDNNPLNELRPTGGIYYLSYSYDFGFRAGRPTELIREKLARGEKITVEDMQSFQGDTVQLLGRRLTPFIISAFEAAGRPEAPQALRELRPALEKAVEEYLAKWSFNTPTGLVEGFDYGKPAGVPPTEQQITDSIATTLFNVWLSIFIQNTIDATLDRLSQMAGLPQPLPKPPSQFAVKAVLHLLENFDHSKGIGASGLNFFDVPELELPPELERDVLILRSLREALGLLASEAFAPAFGGSRNLKDYRWGRLHWVVFRHALGGPFNIPPGAGFEEYAFGIPTDGALGTVDASGYGVRARDYDDFDFSGGPSQRFVAEVRPTGPVAANSIPGGASGTPGRPHYGDLLYLWLPNDYFQVAFDRHSIFEHAEAIQDFLPVQR